MATYWARSVLKEENITYRESRAEDRNGISSLNSSFRTNTVFCVNVASGGLGFTVKETTNNYIIVKKYPDESEEEDDVNNTENKGEDDNSISAASIQAEDGISCPSNTYAMVALGDFNYVCGSIGTNYHAWNKRLVMTCLVISPDYRGRGISWKLMEIVTERGHNIHGAARVWLEVANINALAIKAYLRVGFRICGLDLSLYEGTTSEGEIALFMSRLC